MKIITSGRKYLDIDAYASMIAYRELLKSLGENARAITTARFNQSVPKLVRDLGYNLETNAKIPASAEFIILDVSNPDFFDTFVEPEKIIEVIDHHTGFERYWKEQLGKKAEIKQIGSVCTVIYEKIAVARKLEILTPGLCKMLVAGILDNTLNLQSNMTTEEDVQALQALMKYGKLSGDFANEYFADCYAEVKKDLAGAIRDDTKVEKVSPVLPKVFGQLIVPRIEDFDTSVLDTAFAEYPEWIMNIIALEDGKSYIYFSDNKAGGKLEKLFTKNTEGGKIVLNKMMLRKEIVKLARGHAS